MTNAIGMLPASIHPATRRSTVRAGPWTAVPATFLEVAGLGAGERRQPVLIAEGYATAATLHEMTGMPAIVAFYAGNLLPVAQTYRGTYPDRAIDIAGDDDRQRTFELDPQGKPKVNDAASPKSIRPPECGSASQGPLLFGLTLSGPFGLLPVIIGDTHGLSGACFSATFAMAHRPYDPLRLGRCSQSLVRS